MALRLWASRTATTFRLRCDRHLILPLTRAYSTGGRKFLKSHEWVSLDGEVGTVGISDFAQNELGEIVFVDIPEAGTSVTKGETFGVVESVKAASDVYSPVTGEVVEVNEELSTNPGLVNSGPFSEGWIMKVKVASSGEVDTLLDEAAYKKQCEESAH